jgi:hypothetical protein
MAGVGKATLLWPEQGTTKDVEMFGKIKGMWASLTTAEDTAAKDAPDMNEVPPAGCEHVETGNPPCEVCAPAPAPPPMMDYQITFQNGRKTSGVGVIRFMGDGICRIQEEENKVVVFDLRAAMYMTLQQHRMIQKPELVVPSDVGKKA